MKTKYCKVIIFVLFVSILLVGCSSKTVTPILTSTSMPILTSTTTPIPTSTPTIVTGKADLIVEAKARDKTPGYEADVYVFSSSDGELIENGRTTKGIYVVQLDSGLYDIAFVYDGKPLLGQMQKSILAEPNKPNPVVFVLPPEGKIKIVVLMKNGKTPYKKAYVTIDYGDQNIVSGSHCDIETCSLTYVLRTGYTYSVTVRYGSATKTDDDITFTNETEVTEGQTTEKVFNLPYDETKLTIKVMSGNKAVSVDSVVITDADTGNTIYKTTYWSSSSQVILESEKNYKVQVTYKGSLQEQTIKPSTGELELTFTYP